MEAVTAGGSRPVWTPMIVAGITSSPNSSTAQCTGRTNSSSRSPQRIRLGIGSPASAADHDAGNQIGGGRARFEADMDQPCALVGFLPLQIGDGRPRRSGRNLPPLWSAWPSGPKAALNCRTAPFKLAVGLTGRQIFNQHRQPAWSGETAQIVTGQPGFFQTARMPCSKASDRWTAPWAAIPRCRFRSADRGVRHEPPPG
jgi:hypothetical protein